MALFPRRSTGGQLTGTGGGSAGLGNAAAILVITRLGDVREGKALIRRDRGVERLFQADVAGQNPFDAIVVGVGGGR